MTYKQGDVVLLPFPFTDQQGTKVRPGIVVSNALVSNVSTDVIIVQLTTQNLSSNALAVELNNKHITIPFKPPHNTQFVYCKKVLVIDSQIIIKKISAVADKVKLKEILTVIKSVFDIEL
ncbi:type II toxin-antitoxin system PemK/MazF family toxin [Mucilaginibacter sp.]|uniref:type II toxin-antitoxin system PemK/MazF family toxin n=1 Tax=Mucilaginibacter sp. TaxID=1882438 RepID=UPI003AFF97F1